MFSFHHVSFSVRNLEISVAFYSHFGFREVFRWTSDDNTLTISHLKLGDSILELFCFSDSSPCEINSLSLESGLRRIGIKHFALRVRSIKDAFDALSRSGIVPEAEIRRGRTEIDYFFVRDPDGVFLEIVQDDRALN